MGQSIGVQIKQTPVFIHRLGTVGAVASNGAGAIPDDTRFIAPYNMQILSAWRSNISASDVTKGTATSSASYRRMTIVNGSTDGSGTTVMASLNATASCASLNSRAFATTANNTIAAGCHMFASHLTVGAATADGTDMAANILFIAYSLL